MKLSDFYYEDAAQTGDRMPIPLKDGSDSGEWLNVISPEADASVKASRAFLLAYRKAVAGLAELKGECEANGDFTEYNIRLGAVSSDLNRQMALELVNDWSLTDEFSKENLEKLLSQYLQLGDIIVKFHNEQRRKLQEK